MEGACTGRLKLPVVAVLLLGKRRIKFGSREEEHVSRS